MTEYMLVISVIVLTVIAVLYDPLAQQMQSGSTDFRSNMASGAEAGAVGQNVGNDGPR